MAAAEQREDARWEHLMESVDLLFAKVGVIDHNQQQLNTQMDLSAQVVERMLRDQEALAKKMELTGQAVAQLTLDRHHPPPESPRPLHHDARHRGFQQGTSSRDNEVFPSHNHRDIHRNHSEHHSYSRNALPKLSFPMFYGVNPAIWKDKCLDYFHFYNIPESLWVTSASLNMDENSSKWYQMYKLTNGVSTWSEFIKVVEQQFGSFEYRDAMVELVSLYQEGALEDYISAFVNLQYQITMYNTGMDQIYFVTQFIKGLKPELRFGVQSQVPETMQRAIMLARVQQQIADSKPSKATKYQQFSKFSTQSTKSDVRSNTSTSSLWKERQLRDFRKANGLCMYCGDKFDAAHAASCSKRPQNQVHSLVVNDLDQPLSDEILTQLAMEDSVTQELEQLSLNALAGTAVGDVQNKVMLVLIDSGSSNSFVSASFLNRAGLTTVPTTPKQVKLPNGQLLVSDSKVPQMEWWCQGHTLVHDMQVLELTAYDAILGYDWLKLHSTMTCLWNQYKIEFVEKGKLIQLQGVQPAPMSITPVSVTKLVKLHKSNDIWALALITSVLSHPRILIHLRNCRPYSMNLRMCSPNHLLYHLHGHMTIPSLFYQMQCQ